MLLHMTGSDRSNNQVVFGEMFRQRKIVFHDHKNWDVQIVDGQYEVDQYDREDTSYLMAFGRDDQLVGSVRLLSTATPHMMSGPFARMFPGVSLTSPLIWEATRFVVWGDDSAQPNRVSTAACEILLGMCRFGLEYGVRHITAVYEGGMGRLYRRCGLKHEELARYRTPEHGVVCLGLWEISEALEASILAATGLAEDGGRLATQAA